MDEKINISVSNNKTKIGFFCSRSLSAKSVLKCYDWATDQKEKDVCIISGFHSKIEKDVLLFLLKNKTPVIWVLARKPYKNIPDGLNIYVENGLLTIISTSDTVRQSKETSLMRNEYIASISDELVFASLSKESSLYPLYEKAKMNNKPIILL